MEKQVALAALGALAQESRLDIFRVLVAEGVAGIPAGAIGEKLGIANATLSFHLQQLKHAGLLTYQRRGTQIIYAADYAMMNALLQYLTENCCQGEPCQANTCCTENQHLET